MIPLSLHPEGVNLRLLLELRNTVKFHGGSLLTITTFDDKCIVYCLQRLY